MVLIADFTECVGPGWGLPSCGQRIRRMRCGGCRAARNAMLGLPLTETQAANCVDVWGEIPAGIPQVVRRKIERGEIPAGIFGMGADYGEA